MLAGALDRGSILELVQGSPPLVDDYLDLNDQLQPNGFDLTLKEVSRYATAGYMGRLPDQRIISQHEPLSTDGELPIQLDPGAYLVTFNEVVNLPNHLMALGRPRSSLLRCGVTVHTAVWDAGYHGRSQAMLVVHNPLGYRLTLGARIIQLVFLPLASPLRQGYQGAFQGENLSVGED